MREYIIQGIKPMPKKRPQSGKGRTFMPREYQQWKQAVRDYLAAFYSPAPTLAPVALGVEFRGPSRPRGDLDNLLGGLMDALQPPRAKGDVRAQRALEQSVSLEDRLAMAPGCLYGDDRQVVEILGLKWVKAKKPEIVLRIEERA